MAKRERKTGLFGSVVDNGMTYAEAISGAEVEAGDGRGPQSLFENIQLFQLADSA